MTRANRKHGGRDAIVLILPHWKSPLTTVVVVVVVLQKNFSRPTGIFGPARAYYAPASRGPVHRVLLRLPLSLTDFHAVLSIAFNVFPLFLFPLSVASQSSVGRQCEHSGGRRLPCATTSYRESGRHDESRGGKNRMKMLNNISTVDVT